MLFPSITCYYMINYTSLHADRFNYMMNYIVLPEYYMVKYSLLHAARFNYTLNYIVLHAYYISHYITLHAACLCYMTNYMSFTIQLHDNLHDITCFMFILHVITCFITCHLL